MKDIFDKISSYNFFNYLFPGVVFALIVENILEYKLVQTDIITGFFVYYFIGLIISRFGSLIIEPTLKKINFLKFSNYEDFVNSSRKDEKIELLSEVNNTYRTLVSMLVIILCMIIIEFITRKFPFLKDLDPIILIIILLIMFLYSYKKQTNYITKRINAILNKNN